MDRPIRIVFMGTATLAQEVLRALLDESMHEVVGIVSQPDRPAGRKMKHQPTPVKLLAMERGLEVFQPEKIKSPDSLKVLQSWKPDLGVVAAYGQLLSESVLSLPTHGCLNVHTSILPKYRGAAPIQWAIHDQQKETGVTIMKMDKGMDTGDIISIEKTPIDPEETSGMLHDRLAKIGGALLIKTISGYLSGEMSPYEQNHQESSHARKINKLDGLIDWYKKASEIKAHTNAFSPWPGSYTYLSSQQSEKPDLVKIWKIKAIENDDNIESTPGEIVVANKNQVVVKCGGHSAIELLEIQFPGAKRLSIDSVQSAKKFKVGDRFINKL